MRRGDSALAYGGEYAIALFGRLVEEKKTGEGFPLCCVGARARVCATSECPRPSVRSSELLVTNLVVCVPYS